MIKKPLFISGFLYMWAGNIATLSGGAVGWHSIIVICGGGKNAVVLMKGEKHDFRRIKGTASKRGDHTGTV